MYDQIKDCIWYISLLCSLLHIIDMCMHINHKTSKFSNFLHPFLEFQANETEKEDASI